MIGKHCTLSGHNKHLDCISIFSIDFSLLITLAIQFYISYFILIAAKQIVGYVIQSLKLSMQMEKSGQNIFFAQRGNLLLAFILPTVGNIFFKEG